MILYAVYTVYDIPRAWHWLTFSPLINLSPKAHLYSLCICLCFVNCFVWGEEATGPGTILTLKPSSYFSYILPSCTANTNDVCVYMLCFTETTLSNDGRKTLDTTSVIWCEDSGLDPWFLVEFKVWHVRCLENIKKVQWARQWLTSGVKYQIRWGTL